jgi:hypothetical protein
MVSLRKYLDLKSEPALNHAERGNSSTATSAQTRLLSALCSEILDQIEKHILPDKTGSPNETGADLRRDFAQGRAGVEENISPENIRVLQQAVEAAFASHISGEKVLAQRIAAETQQMVGVLNDALVALSGGSERSVSRLQHIQESLQHTSRIRDPEGLRASLAEAMVLIREESAREKEHAARDLAAFESQVVRVRKQLSENPARRLRGRAEAVRALSDAVLTIKPENTTYTVAFSLANVEATTHRYGPESVDELFIQVLRERVHPLGFSSTSWRWSPACIVAMFEGPSDMQVLQARLAELSRAPFVYRMTLGNRTAVLKVGLSHMIIALTASSFGTLIAEIDRFSRYEEIDAR